jgi:hypothetical protein
MTTQRTSEQIRTSRGKCPTHRYIKLCSGQFDMAFCVVVWNGIYTGWFKSPCVYVITQTHFSFWTNLRLQFTSVGQNYTVTWHAHYAGYTGLTWAHRILNQFRRVLFFAGARGLLNWAAYNSFHFKIDNFVDRTYCFVPLTSFIPSTSLVCNNY